MHRVVLVREWDAQMGSSGCCGRLGGACNELGEADTFAHVRADMEAMGAVYRALRTAFGRDDVEISVVDPRNTIWLVPTVWRDARRRGYRPGRAWREVRRAVAASAVVVDGLVVFTGSPPHPDEAVAVVRAELSAV